MALSESSLGERSETITARTSAVVFKPAKAAGTYPMYATGAGYLGVLLDEKGQLVAHAAVAVELAPGIQTRECLKIGHVDIGNG